MSEEENFKQQLAKLREEFRASLTSRIDQIVAAVDHLAGAADTGIEFEPVFREIHTLACSAGTFGFHRLSDQAR